MRRLTPEPEHDDTSIWLDALIARARSEGAPAAAAFLGEERTTLVQLRKELRHETSVRRVSPFVYTLR
jgi:hypothetical protein